MDRKKLILIIAGVVILTVATFVLGFGYGFRAREGQVRVERQVTVLELLELPMIHSLETNIFGQVIKITNRTLTVTENNETIRVPIKQDARVALFLPEQFIDVAFEDIKINDKVDIRVNIKPDGQIRGVRVIIRR